MSMDLKAFNALIDEIMSQGYDEGTAAEYAELIGDMPITNAAGQVVVKKDGRTVAKLKPLKFFGAHGD